MWGQTITIVNGMCGHFESKFSQFTESKIFFEILNLRNLKNSNQTYLMTANGFSDVVHIPEL